MAALAAGRLLLKALEEREVPGAGEARSVAVFVMPFWENIWKFVEDSSMSSDIKNVFGFFHLLIFGKSLPMSLERPGLGKFGKKLLFG